jgi:large subunit ribosomal protein L10
VVAHYKGLTVAEMTDLRGQVRKAGGNLRVAKNRLAKRALEETSFTGIADLLKGPTALVYSTDPVAAPKALTEFAKKNDKLQILGGSLGSSILDLAAVKALAELPSLDTLRAGLIGLLQTPAQRLVSLLQAPGGQVARVLKAHADKAGDAGAAE